MKQDQAATNKERTTKTTNGNEHSTKNEQRTKNERRHATTNIITMNKEQQNEEKIALNGISELNSGGTSVDSGGTRGGGAAISRLW